MRINPVVAGIGDPMDATELVINTVKHLNAQLSFNKVNAPENEVVYLTIDTVWNDNVSNMHDCPLNAVTNWHYNRGNNDNPSGYPGWEGKVWFALAKKIPPGITSASALLVQRCIYPGSGGGGDHDYPFASSLIQTYGWNVKIFEADWPSLRLGNLITNQDSNNIKVGYHNPKYHMPSPKIGENGVHKPNEHFTTYGSLARC